MESITRRKVLGGIVAGLALVGLGGITALIPRILCVWNMGTPCDGRVSNRLMFDNQLEIPICDQHLHEHREVMALHDKGHDIEEIVDMSPSRRKELIAKYSIDLCKVIV